MTDDSQPDPEAAAFLPLLAKLHGLPSDAFVRVAVGWLEDTLGEYGLKSESRPSSAMAADALESASALLGRFAADLRERAAEEEAEAGDDAQELLSPAIRQAFVKGCAPASPKGLERAIIDYRLAHLVIARVDSQQLAWNDPAAGDAPSPATVRADISRLLKAAQALRETMTGISGEAIGRVSAVPYKTGRGAGFASAALDITGELIGHAETALVELGDNASPGRTVSPKTRLALWLGDFLASSGVPVVIDSKPSDQWALAYDLALEAAGDGPCPHARKTLQNAIALRRKERMPPAA